MLYSLSSTCFTVAETRRLDGFQNRCLRKILGIKPAFISRVSNAKVLGKAGCFAASKQLQKRQLQLFGKILRCPDAHPLKQASFARNTSLPITDWYVRRRGRPNKEWVPEVKKQALQITDSWESLLALSANKIAWNNILSSHFGF